MTKRNVLLRKIVSIILDALQKCLCRFGIHLWGYKLIDYGSVEDYDKFPRGVVYCIHCGKKKSDR